MWEKCSSVPWKHCMVSMDRRRMRSFKLQLCYLHKEAIATWRCLWRNRETKDNRNRTRRVRTSSETQRKSSEENRRKRNFLTIFPLFHLLSFPEDLNAVHSCEVVKAGFSEFTGLIHCFCNFNMVFISFEADQLDVYQGALYTSMAKEPFHVQDVLRPVILHGSLPMAKRVELDLVQPWVLKPILSLPLL